MDTTYSRWSLAAALVAAGALFSGCAPEPRNVPCSNDAQCAEANEDFRYCLQSRCVECVTSASCGEGNVCDDGECAEAK